ncbi:hypothetical protein [Piscinibacter sp. XHJ-5]|uniref:hypothetical protein n=1 Tax=Piscinibacter sp. XHJ-5 TaxID=3037797 RepID=UPI002452B035|nr:hypothetical protein [Piscinibacter sp. XHJ-5]
MKTFVVDEPSVGALRALNYSPAVERIRRAGSNSARPLSSIVKEFGRAYGTVFTRRDCDSNHGVELITQGDMFAAEPTGRIIRLDSMHHPERHIVTRGQVLISGAGTLGENELFGRSILADGRLVGKYVGPHAMALQFEAPDDDFSLFTYAWLACPTGIQAIRSTSYGTKILGLRKDLLGSLPIPLAHSSVVGKIASLVRSCSEGRETFLRDIRRARTLVEQLPEMQQAHEMCGALRRHSIMWSGPFPSLVAWNFASSGGALRHLRTKWKSTLGDLVEQGGIYNGPRFARVECRPPFGVEFMSQRDAMLIRPAPRQIVHPGFDDRLLFAREGTILVGGHGTLGEGEVFGRAVLVHGRYSQAAFTQDLLRVVPKASKAHALYAYLTTTVGFRLLRTTAVGTKILSLREDMLRALPVPDWPTDVERDVSELVRSAFDARVKAEHAETEALRIIEQEVVPQWLE